uniref:Cytochrome c oxidase subunit 2 n=1 Tax=Ceraphronidae sp. ZJUH_2016007 TaxID=2491153 RepID=A0A3S8V0G6_9HYME|nr:cytochrome c oxidase subunit 2 [Ceraphronidae sp. ZJUH_2016007]
MATWWSNIMLLDPISSNSNNLVMFHDYLMTHLILITLMISYIMTIFISNNLPSMNLIHHHMLEMIWTLLPMIILMFIALPSLQALYLLDEMNNPLLTIKAIGHQWYWSYEYPELKLMFDSTLSNPPILFRCLECNNNMMIPYLTKIRMLTTSEDVIHSWTIPNLSIKMDAVPGRLNQTEMMVKSPGIYFGQCSEICGSNHSFMPITLESIKI